MRLIRVETATKPIKERHFLKWKIVRNVPVQNRHFQVRVENSILVLLVTTFSISS